MASDIPGYVAPGTFVSSGAAVANQLSDILTQKRLEARQKMLDDLNVQNIQSEMQDRQAHRAWQMENAKSLAADRDAQAKQRAADAEEKNLKVAGQWAQGMGPEGIGNEVSPDSIQKYHIPQEWLNPGASGEPLADGDVGPVQPKSGPTFRGDPASLKQRRLQDQQSGYMDDLGSLPKDLSSGDLIRLMVKGKQLFGENLPIDKLFPPDKKGVHRVEYDRNGNVLSEKDYPAGSSFGTIPAPQQPNSVSIPQLYQTSVPDPANPGKTVTESHWLKPGELPSEKNLIPTVVRKGNEPVPPTGGKGKDISDRTRDELLQAQKVSRQRPNDPETEAQLNAIIGRVLDEIHVSPRAKEWASQAWQSKARRGKPFEAISNTPDDDKDKQDMLRAWKIMNGQS